LARCCLCSSRRPSKRTSSSPSPECLCRRLCRVRTLAGSNGRPWATPCTDRPTPSLRPYRPPRSSWSWRRYQGTLPRRPGRCRLGQWLVRCCRCSSRRPSKRTSSSPSSEYLCRRSCRVRTLAGSNGRPWATPCTGRPTLSLRPYRPARSSWSWRRHQGTLPRRPGQCRPGSSRGACPRNSYLRQSRPASSIGLRRA